MTVPLAAGGGIARIARSSTRDGAGIRTVVFFKGCRLRCLWCHSPETQAFHPEILLRNDRCIGCGACVAVCDREAARLSSHGPAIDRLRCERCGRCAARCPTGARELHGTVMDADGIMRAIRRDVPFYDRSGGGVTFSGGEPFLQPALLEALLERCRVEGIRTAIETCGHGSRRAMLRAWEHAPQFLFDVKLVDDGRHRAATGVSNQLILSNLRVLANRNADIVIRFPLVPGMTDDRANVTAVAALAASIGIGRIDLLPYHRAGIARYARLGRMYPCNGTGIPTADSIASTATLMRDFGLDVHIGGSS